jgi:large subunit ribosomal protein L24
MAAKLKKGDVVVVLSGADKGTQGEILEVIPSQCRATVRGVNMRVKHRRPKTQGESGKIVSIECPIHLSNLAYLDKNSEKGSRVGFRFKDGKKVRFLKKTGEDVNG